MAFQKPPSPHIAVDRSTRRRRPLTPRSHGIPFSLACVCVGACYQSDGNLCVRACERCRRLERFARARAHSRFNELSAQVQWSPPHTRPTTSASTLYYSPTQHQPPPPPPPQQHFPKRKVVPPRKNNVYFFHSSLLLLL